MALRLFAERVFLPANLLGQIIAMPALRFHLILPVLSECSMTNTSRTQLGIRPEKSLGVTVPQRFDVMKL